MKALFFILAVLFFTQQATADDDYIYCQCSAPRYEEQGRFYSSAIFLGDSDRLTSYSLEFSRFISEKYGDSCSFTIHHCAYGTSRRSAEAELEESRERYTSRPFNDRPIMTNWKPDDAGEEFIEQSLQDFNITVDGNSSELEICVRDYECEDGDRIRVTVDGSKVYEGEIDNGWDCSRLDVRAGQRYSVELYAINGTGHKGNCAHRDVNTGEIKVTGANTITQSWRHRGGTGSRSRIIVNSR